MSEWIAALPMYDWPETRTEVDAQWAAIRDALRAYGVDAPEGLARRNADMPAVPGGIRGVDGAIVAADPATLPPEEFDMRVLWRHPRLLFGQTCWGPMELGLATDVTVLGQPDYSSFAGGRGPLYSSAIVMRWKGPDLAPPADGRALLPIGLVRGKRLAFNGADSMSGVIALARDLDAAGETADVFSVRLPSGSHRNSIIAVAEGRADIAAIDCRSWAIARRFEPAAHDVSVVGWTALRTGLPYIASRDAPTAITNLLRAVL